MTLIAKLRKELSFYRARTPEDRIALGFIVVFLVLMFPVVLLVAVCSVLMYALGSATDRLLGVVSSEKDVDDVF